METAGLPLRKVWPKGIFLRRLENILWNILLYLVTNNLHYCHKLTWQSKRCVWNRRAKFKKFKCSEICHKSRTETWTATMPTTWTSIASVNCTCCSGQILEHLPMLSTSRSPSRSKFHHWQSIWKQKAAKAQVLLPYYVFVTANPHFEGARPLLPEVWETGNFSWQENVLM